MYPHSTKLLYLMAPRCSFLRSRRHEPSSQGDAARVEPLLGDSGKWTRLLNLSNLWRRLRW
jgi:hypothetical protein